MLGRDYAEIICPCCKTTSKISSKAIKTGKKWILSNFNKHLKSHLNIQTPSQTPGTSKAQAKIGQTPIQTNILSFMKQDGHGLKNIRTNTLTRASNTRSNTSSCTSSCHEVEPRVERSQLPNQGLCDADDCSDDCMVTDEVTDIFFENSRPSNGLTGEADLRPISQESARENESILSISSGSLSASVSKWKDPKYSRTERNQRSLTVMHTDQPKITDFLKIVHKIDELLETQTITLASY